MATIKLRVWARYDKWNKDWHFCVHETDLDMSDVEGYVAISEAEVSYEAPSREVLQTGTVASFKAALQKTRGEHYATEQRMEETIQELLALPAPAQEKASDDIPF